VDSGDLLGPLEARIMDDLWEAGPSKVGEVLERLNEAARRPLAYTTVMSVLARLERKGYLRRARDGKAYVYEPVHGRDGFVQSRAAAAVAGLLDDFGSAVVVGFVDTVKERPELLRQLEELIAEGDGADDASP
jgi:predicted transcriptional regulator